MMATIRKSSDVLICIPCFNSQETIVQVVAPLLRDSDADLLLVDDLSEQSLHDFVQQRFPHVMHRITVVRPVEKVFCGGAKNLGILAALEQAYRIVILLDSDIVTPQGFVERIREFFQHNPTEVIVAPPILPDGHWCQYADTLINFSSYLPDPRRDISRKPCLAGYAFALNLDRFRLRPCYHDARYGGEDVLFFRKLRKQFSVSGFPVLNRVPVFHQPPRSTLKQALAAQRRYGRAFFTHNNQPREYLFNKLPVLHLLTPRLCLMTARLLRLGRFHDLIYLPLCWCLDFARAIQITRLYREGYQDPAEMT